MCTDLHQVIIGRLPILVCTARDLDTALIWLNTQPEHVGHAPFQVADAEWMTANGVTAPCPQHPDSRTHFYASYPGDPEGDLFLARGNPGSDREETHG